ncbi:helix-turn-helix domain-containing protein [Brevundimonas faecalis]|uniref:Two-component system cell cycle response regulator CtrA n=1 Tax=Brevundimonas faecalis TaxID=947378 RepID=A0ABV2RAV9_9CAUL
MAADPVEFTAREQALQATIVRLEDRIQELEAAMGLCVLPPLEWGLTHSEARLLGALLERELLTKDAAMAVLYRDRGADEPEIKIVDVLVCKARKKLKPFGIEIGTRWGVGYFIAPAHKAEARVQIEAARQVAA